jgi:hypothetical protein
VVLLKTIKLTNQAITKATVSCSLSHKGHHFVKAYIFTSDNHQLACVFAVSSCEHCFANNIIAQHLQPHKALQIVLLLLLGFKPYLLGFKSYSVLALCTIAL